MTPNGSPKTPVALWKAVLAAVLAAVISGLGTSVALLSLAATRSDVATLRAELLAHDAEQTQAIAQLDLRLTRLEQSLIDYIRSTRGR